MGRFSVVGLRFAGVAFAAALVLTTTECAVRYAAWRTPGRVTLVAGVELEGGHASGDYLMVIRADETTRLVAPFGMGQHADPLTAKVILLEPGVHTVDVWIVDRGRELKVASTSFTVRVMAQEAMFAIHVRGAEWPMSLPFESIRDVELIKAGLPRQFVLTTAALAALRDALDASTLHGEVNRAQCLRTELDELAYFEMTRDLDTLGDDWSKRKSKRALDAADSCRNDPAPIDPDICTNDPAQCAGSDQGK